MASGLAYYVEMTTSSSKQLVSKFNDIVITTYGQHQVFKQTASPLSCGADDLVFVFESGVTPDTAAVIVTCQKVAEQIKGTSSAFIVVVDDVRLAQAKIKRHFDDYKAHDQEWDAIHVSAVIHDTVTFGDGCRVGPNAVIGAHCVLAENVTVRAGAVIEHAVVIGAGSVINANVNIGYNSQLGQRQLILLPQSALKVMASRPTNRIVITACRIPVEWCLETMFRLARIAVLTEALTVIPSSQPESKLII